VAALGTCLDGGVLIVAVFISTVVGRRRAGYAVTMTPEPDEPAPITEPGGVTADA
jgi:hypothetical protein